MCIRDRAVARRAAHASSTCPLTSWRSLGTRTSASGTRASSSSSRPGEHPCSSCSCRSTGVSSTTGRSPT
eukprot:1611233-Alexandrium_andersonii.AAC.1